MKKVFLSLAVAVLPLFAFSQTEVTFGTFSEDSIANQEISVEYTEVTTDSSVISVEASEVAAEISEVSTECPEVSVATPDAYIYNIISFSGNIHKRGFKAKMDNGRKIKRIKDANGRKLRFRTPAAALTYLASEGWELCQDGVSVKGAGNKSETTTYWVIRKRCTQEELEQALAVGVRR